MHFESHDKDNQHLISQYQDHKISEMPEQVQIALMQEQVNKYHCKWVVCDCNRCLNGIKLGGGNPVHLLDLVMDQFHVDKDENK